MFQYIMNRNFQQNGDLEIHCLGNHCPKLPASSNMIPLGYFENCHEAISAAKIRWPQYEANIDGCYHCCRPCHTH